MDVPKRQAYPSSKIIVGSVLYSCCAWTDDAGKPSIEISEWVIRSIQAKRGSKTRFGIPVHSFGEVAQYVNLVEKKDRVTWGKRSSKHGDFGWLKTIPSACRKQFRVGTDLPHGVYTTVRAAVMYQLMVTRDSLAICKAADLALRDDVEIAELEIELAALQRRLSRLEAAGATN